MTYDGPALDRMENATDADSLARELHNHPKDWKNEWVDLGPTSKVRRPNINFGHLALTETIEFRGFTVTADPIKLWNIIQFPLDFIRAGLREDSDPVRIVRGRTYQEQFKIPAMPFAARSSLYFNRREDYRNYLAILLLNKDITLADLNYPQFWIDRGFG